MDNDDNQQFEEELAELVNETEKTGIDCRAELRRRADECSDQTRKGEALHWLGIANLRQRDLKGAEVAFLEMCENPPGAVTSLLVLARFYAFDAGDPQRGVDIFDNILSGAVSYDGFVRNLHMERICVASRAKRQDIATESLKVLLDFVPPAVSDELRLGSHLITSLRALGVDSDLIEQYEKKVTGEAKR